MRKARKYSSTVVKNVLDSIDKGEYARIESRMTISAMIAKRIEELGISKIKFSELMDVQPSIVTRWLSGTHNFTIDTITDIQVKLGIKILNTSVPKLDTATSYLGKDHAVIVFQYEHKVSDSDTHAMCNIPKEKEDSSFFILGSSMFYQSSQNSAANFNPCSSPKSALLYK